MRLDVLARGQQLRLAAQRQSCARLMSTAQSVRRRITRTVVSQARQSAAFRELELQQEERQLQSQESKLPTGTMENMSTNQ